jgi:NHL repeat
MISDRPPRSYPPACSAVPRSLSRRSRIVLPALVCLCSWFALGAASAQARPFIEGLQPSTVATTVPSNGDVNPYGIVTVPRSVGLLQRGAVLVSNFNNSATVNPPGGEQGTGTTIVQIAPGGPAQTPAPLFAKINPKTLPGPCPGGVGLTTALAVTRSGFVIVGSLPTTDGTSATAQAGCLLVLNSRGQVVETIAGGPINGPWDMTAVDHGFFTTLYVTNVLNGTLAASPDPTVPGGVVNGGTVVRIQLLTIPGIRPVVLDEDVIATGFAERTDPAALVLGPTGVALGRDGTLYVADTVNSRIAAIPGAPFRFFPATGGGRTVFQGTPLNAPLGMTLAPNGDILTANGNDGNIVETTPGGTPVATVAADPNAGALFGLTLTPDRSGVYYVDDGTNTLNVLAPIPMP